MIDDYLFCEPLIIERIRAELPELVEVLSAGELARVQDDKPICPAVYVIFSGDVISDSVESTGGIRRVVQATTQLWTVVLAVQLADGRGLAEETNAEAGPLLAKLSRALQGWMPEDGLTKPMKRAAQPLQPLYEPDGYAYFPVVWQTFFINR